MRVVARTFDINVGGRLPSEERPKRYIHAEDNGQETPNYLRLDHVPAIVVTPRAGTTGSGGRGTI